MVLDGFLKLFDILNPYFCWLFIKPDFNGSLHQLDILRLYDICFKFFNLVILDWLVQRFYLLLNNYLYCFINILI